MSKFFEKSENFTGQQSKVIIYYYSLVMFTNGQPVWRNWQTHKTQNLAGATSCGFKSHRRHKPVINRLLVFLLLKEPLVTVPNGTQMRP